MAEERIHDLGEAKWWRKRPSPEEFQEILNDHKKWLEGGAKGDPPHNLCGIDLNLSSTSKEKPAKPYQKLLKNIDLRKINLSYAFLQGADLRHAKLQDVNFFSAELGSTHFDYAYLDNASLFGTRLEGTSFRGARLVHTNLSLVNAKVYPTPQRTTNYFEDAYLLGANFQYAILPGANFEGADFSFADLTRANLMQSNMLAAKLYDANMLNANLHNVVGLISQNLARSMLEGAILPDNVVRFEAIDSALKSIQHTRKIFTTTILLGIYMCWQSWRSEPNDMIGIKSIDLVLEAPDFAMASFFLFLALCFFYNIYLNRVWCSYATLPAVFPHGEDTTLYPDSWLNLNVYSSYVIYGSKMDLVSRVITSFLNFWIFPTIILIATAGFLRYGDLKITSFHLVISLMIVWASINSYLLAKNNLSRTHPPHRKKSDFILLCLFIVFMIITYLLQASPHFSSSLEDAPPKPTQHYPGSI